MARPRKASEDKFVGRQIKFPRLLWAAVEEQVPDRERASFIRRAIEDALLRRAAEEALVYYTTDEEALAWGDFLGDGGDE